MKRLLVAALASSALVLAACGSTADAPAEGDAQAAQDIGPLAEFMGYAEYDAEAGQAENDAKQKKVEELTAACMKEEGFEYKPADYAMYEDPNAAAWEISGTREFAEKYGYGVALSNSFESMSGQDEWVDPNAEYVEAMTESERVAYYDALYGAGSGAGIVESIEAEPASTGAAEASAAEPATTDQADAESSSSEDESAASTEAEPTEAEPTEPSEYVQPSPEEMGCSGRASAEVWPNSMMTEPDDDVTQMWDEYNRRMEALNDSPELAAAITEWKNCLADKGYPGVERDQWGSTNQDDLQKEWSELHGATFESMDGGWSITPPETPVTPDPADVAAFKQKEIAQAVADFDCSTGLTELRSKLQFEMEEKFVEEFKEPLTKQRDLENG